MSNSKTCVFFGHQDTPNIEIQLLEAIVTAIETEGINEFYVGSNGRFDNLAATAVSKMRETYPNIKLFLILAYMPTEKTVISDIFDGSIYADELEFVPKKFAISHRNRWMVQSCDLVISYVKCSYGGAYDAVHYAKNQNKIIINLAKTPKQ